MPQSLTADMLHSIMPHCLRPRLEECLPHLIAAMLEFDITTKLRAAAFLATIAVESGELNDFREKGRPDYFKKYEGRMGNKQPGDGLKYKGRGAIQITGRQNYEACLKDLHLPAEHPESLEEIGNAFRSAGWYWKIRHLNVFADKEDFFETQKRVNGLNRETGKPNGWYQRLNYYNCALETLPTGWVLTEEDAAGL